MSKHQQQQPPPPMSLPPPEDGSTAAYYGSDKKEQLDEEGTTASAFSFAVTDRSGHTSSNSVTDNDYKADADDHDDDGHGDGQSAEGRERTVNWLSMGKQAAESRCGELEKELAKSRELCAQQKASLVVSREKIRHLEAENKGLLTAAEFREKEASALQAGSEEARERAQAHEQALANALNQLSDSGVSQSKKLLELAETSRELKRTKEALERAERIVFEKRQEADERLFEENKRRLETDGLRDRLSQVERFNTELITKQAAGKLTKKFRGNFGRSSTFCASFCSFFRGRPTYRRVTSAGGVHPQPTALSSIPSLPDESPWLG